MLPSLASPPEKKACTRVPNVLLPVKEYASNECVICGKRGIQGITPDFYFQVQEALFACAVTVLLVSVPGLTRLPFPVPFPPLPFPVRLPRLADKCCLGGQWEMGHTGNLFFSPLPPFDPPFP